MKQEALKHFTEIHLTVLGLVIFFTFFMGTLIWVHRKSSGSLYRRLANLPLQEGDSHEQR